ncbi:MAG TPA: GNAT family N-acetyltransferase [Pseudolabrys sp.]|nr:GNAT family N-acetyltransferase [Pseudolabrys sp.]
MHGTLDSLFHAERRPLAALTAIAQDWRGLTSRALEPNGFYEPAFALAAAPFLGRDAQAILIWSRQSPARLVGLFPLRIARRYGLGPNVLAGWLHPYATLGTPLVERDNADGVIAAWLTHIARDPALPSIAFLPTQTVDGAFCKALDRVLVARGLRHADFGRHRRAHLAPGRDRAGYLTEASGAKHRKELPRRRRRLAELGAISHEIVTREPDVARALDHFFVLEANGWKGSAGTAATQSEDTRDFFRAAVTGLARDGKVRIDVLSVGGRAIAATIVLRSGDTMFGWKTAYDETYAKYSPGAQLMLDLTQSVLADASVARLDSCTSAGHPLVEHLWGDRLSIADRLIGVRPERSAAFSAACALETMRRTGLHYAKALRDRLRG